MARRLTFSFLLIPTLSRSTCRAFPLVHDKASLRNDPGLVLIRRNNPGSLTSQEDWSGVSRSLWLTATDGTSDCTLYSYCSTTIQSNFFLTSCSSSLFTKHWIDQIAIHQKFYKIREGISPYCRLIRVPFEANTSQLMSTAIATTRYMQEANNIKIQGSVQILILVPSPTRQIRPLFRAFRPRIRLLHEYEIPDFSFTPSKSPLG